MLDKFKAREPKIAATIAILFGPVIGLLYLNKGKIALEYFVISLVIIASPFVAAHYDIWPFDPRPAAKILGLVIQIIGAFHCYSIAKEGVGVLKWYAHWYILILPFMFALVCREGFYHPYHIPAASMSPNINAGDYLFANLRAYDNNAPQRGDVIIFKHPKENVDYIKRIIGMPGDHVQLKEGIVYINGVSLPRRQVENYEMNGKFLPRFIETLPEGKQISILKDKNSSITNDTPDYQVPTDNYFVIGDNRDHSMDSRFLSDFGYVPRQNIIGKAAPVLWNTETHKFSYDPTN